MEDLITDQDRTLLEPSIQIEIANIQTYLCQHGFNRQISKHEGAVLPNPLQKIARTANSPSSFIQDKDNITGDQMCLAVNAKPLQLDIDEIDTITISDKFTVYNNPHDDHTDYENNPAPNQTYMDTRTRENSLKVEYQSYLQGPPEVCHSKVADSLTRQNSLIDDKEYESEISQNVFKNSNYLKIHRCIHTGEKPYQFKACQKHFTQASHFNQQKRIHTGEKRFQCDICQKCFRDTSILITHRRIHTGKKPFQCDVCQKCFTQSCALNRHKRLHTGEKPFQCDVCQKCFTRTSHLIQHKPLKTISLVTRCVLL